MENIKQNLQEVYSTNEIKTNKLWVDNKPIYRKVITGLSAFSNGSAINVDTGVTTVDSLINIYGSAPRTGVQRQYPINNVYTECALVKSTGKIYLESISRDVSFSSGGYVVIEYTKTTD